MSREYNYGGTSLIVDSIEELFENGAVQTKTVSNIKQVIGLQRQSKDINKLKEQIESATDDGVITVSEKPGLKREWASLESSYATISDKFTQDDTLKDNSLFYVLKARFNELSPIMDEIFADMNSSYQNAEKISKLTTLFVDCWKYITLCSQLLESKLSISDRFSLQISPNREIVGPLDIRVTLLDLTNGIYSDVTNLSTYLDSDFVWKKTSDENFERTGRVLSLTLDDMSSNEEQFTLTFKHTFTYEDPNATDVVIAKSISFAVSTGTLSQWTWSDAATKADLLMDPFAVWLDYRREFNTKKYLWRRDTNDLLKADSEKEWLYFRESGLDGLIGSNGYSRAVLELFKRSETTPESFDGGVITYTFSTNAISGDTGTWQKTIPDGEHPLYIIKATAFANTETDSISTGEWTTPAILSEHGTDGATGATAFSLVLYQRSEYSPSKPSDIVTYNIKTGAITGNGNWSLSFPSNNGYPCWAINATAFSYTDTDEITPSEWSDVQKLVENGKNGEDGADGKDAKLLSINCTPSAFSVSSRGVTQQETFINVSFVKNNLSGTVSWQVFFDTTLEMEGTGESFDITLPAKVEVARIVIIATCEEHTETLALGAVPNGSAMPMKVAEGVWNTTINPLPTRTNGNEPLILGDYILATNGNEELVTYIWNGIQWTVAEGDFRNYAQAMLGVLDDALASEYTIPSSSVLFQYIKHLTAKNAVIENLFANKIKIEEGGAIYSGAYNEEGEKQGTSEGFHLSEKGKLKAEQAELRNADITGVFECKLDSSEIIFKTQKGATGASVSCSAKSRWCMADLFNAIAYGASGTGTYNGTSHSYIKCGVANPWQVYTINVSDTSIWGKEVVAFRTNCAVTISYSIAGKTATGAWRETYIKQFSSSGAEKFSKKASRDNETASGTLSLSAGDYITLRAEGSGSYVSANASISIIDDAIVLHSSNIPSLLLKNEMKFYDSLTASFGSFNSANNKNYAPITGWFNGFNNNEVATINSSSVSVNGVSYPIIGASKTASNLTLHTSTGIGLSFNGPADTSEGATIGWYNISGTLQKVSETKGVVTNNLIPVKNDISIGTANNPYASVFSTLVQAKNITADGTINITGSGTINGPLVYNAVFS